MNIEIIEEFETIESADTRYNELKTIYPNDNFTVILSKGKYYVESGIPFIRIFEKIIKKTRRL